MLAASVMQGCQSIAMRIITDGKNKEKTTGTEFDLMRVSFGIIGSRSSYTRIDCAQYEQKAFTGYSQDYTNNTRDTDQGIIQELIMFPGGTHFGLSTDG